MSIRKPYECPKCEGTGLIDSEDGGNTIDCPKCEGKGTYNPYTDN